MADFQRLRSRAHARADAATRRSSAGELWHLLEALVESGRSAAVVERTVAEWLRVRDRDEEMPEVMRRLGALQWQRGALGERVRSLDMRGLGTVATIAPLRLPGPAWQRRDAAWFGQLRATAAATRFSLPAEVSWAPTAMVPTAVRGAHRSMALPGGAGFVQRMQTLVAPAAVPGVYALQRDAAGVLEAGRGPSVGEVLRRLGAGRPLQAEVREKLGPALAEAGRAVDLEHVLVHDGPEADALCRELKAHAFALGRHVVFRAGRFAPNDGEGLALLAHELTHVWQQANALVRGAQGRVEEPRFEADAERVGAQVAASIGSNIAPSEREGVAGDPVVARDASALQRCDDSTDTSGRQPGAAPTAASGGNTPAPRATTIDGLMSEARSFVESGRMRPGALFLVADRITGYDAAMRVQGSWALSGPCPLGAGYWFDGGVGIASWSRLDADTINRIAAGRSDDLWVVGAQHAAVAEAAAAPTPAPAPVPTPTPAPTSAPTAPAAASPSEPAPTQERAASAALASPSRPVAASLAERFFAATGVDVSHALVHLGPAVQAAVSALGVNAFAYGHHIAFATAEPSDLLVLHELAHVAQQTGRRADAPATPAATTSDIESEADTIAAAILARRPAVVTLDRPASIAADGPTPSSPARNPAPSLPALVAGAERARPAAAPESTESRVRRGMGGGSYDILMQLEDPVTWDVNPANDTASATLESLLRQLVAERRGGLAFDIATRMNKVASHRAILFRAGVIDASGAVRPPAPPPVRRHAPAGSIARRIHSARDEEPVGLDSDSWHYGFDVGARVLTRPDVGYGTRTAIEVGAHAVVSRADFEVGNIRLDRLAGAARGLDQDVPFDVARSQGHTRPGTNTMTLHADVVRGSIHITIPALDLRNIDYESGASHIVAAGLTTDVVVVEASWPTQAAPHTPSFASIEITGLRLDQLTVSGASSSFGVRSVNIARLALRLGEVPSAFREASEMGSVTRAVSATLGVSGAFFAISKQIEDAQRGATRLQEASAVQPVPPGLSLDIHGLHVVAFASSSGTHADTVDVSRMHVESATLLGARAEAQRRSLIARRRWMQARLQKLAHAQTDVELHERTRIARELTRLGEDIEVLTRRMPDLVRDDDAYLELVRLRGPPSTLTPEQTTRLESLQAARRAIRTTISIERLDATGAGTSPSEHGHLLLEEVHASGTVEAGFVGVEDPEVSVEHAHLDGVDRATLPDYRAQHRRKRELEALTERTGPEVAALRQLTDLWQRPIEPVRGMSSYGAIVERLVALDVGVAVRGDATRMTMMTIGTERATLERAISGHQHLDSLDVRGVRARLSGHASRPEDIYTRQARRSVAGQAEGEIGEVEALGLRDGAQGAHRIAGMGVRGNLDLMLSATTEGRQGQRASSESIARGSVHADALRADGLHSGDVRLDHLEADGLDMSADSAAGRVDVSASRLAGRGLHDRGPASPPGAFDLRDVHAGASGLGGLLDPDFDLYRNRSLDLELGLGESRVGPLVLAFGTLSVSLGTARVAAVDARVAVDLGTSSDGQHQTQPRMLRSLTLTGLRVEALRATLPAGAGIADLRLPIATIDRIEAHDLPLSLPAILHPRANGMLVVQHAHAQLSAAVGRWFRARAHLDVAQSLRVGIIESHGIRIDPGNLSVGAEAHGTAPRGNDTLSNLARSIAGIGGHLELSHIRTQLDLNTRRATLTARGPIASIAVTNGSYSGGGKHIRCASGRLSDLHVDATVHLDPASLAAGTPRPRSIEVARLGIAHLDATALHYDDHTRAFDLARGDLYDIELTRLSLRQMTGALSLGRSAGPRGALTGLSYVEEGLRVEGEIQAQRLEVHRFPNDLGGSFEGLRAQGAVATGTPSAPGHESTIDTGNMTGSAGMRRGIVTASLSVPAGITLTGTHLRSDGLAVDLAHITTGPGRLAVRAAPVAQATPDPNRIDYDAHIDVTLPDISVHGGSVSSGAMRLVPTGGAHANLSVYDATVRITQQRRSPTADWEIAHGAWRAAGALSDIALTDARVALPGIIESGSGTLTLRRLDFEATSASGHQFSFEDLRLGRGTTELASMWRLEHVGVEVTSATVASGHGVVSADNQVDDVDLSGVDARVRLRTSGSELAHQDYAAAPVRVFDVRVPAADHLEGRVAIVLSPMVVIPLPIRGGRILRDRIPESPAIGGRLGALLERLPGGGGRETRMILYELTTALDDALRLRPRLESAINGAMNGATTRAPREGWAAYIARLINNDNTRLAADIFAGEGVERALAERAFRAFRSGFDPVAVGNERDAERVRGEALLRDWIGDIFLNLHLNSTDADRASNGFSGHLASGQQTTRFHGGLDLDLTVRGQLSHDLTTHLRLHSNAIDMDDGTFATRVEGAILTASVGGNAADGQPGVSAGLHADRIHRQRQRTSGPASGR